MNKSGIPGNAGSMALVGIAFVMISIFGIRDARILSQANWLAIVPAGIILATGFLMFNGTLAKADPKDVSLLIAVMVAAQVVAAAAYDGFVMRNLPPMKAAGFVLVAVGGALLTKG